MATLITSSVAALVGGGLWYTFRRRASVLTSEDLPSSAHESIEIAPQLTEEERTAVKTAFLAGDDFRWIVAGKNFKTDLDDKKHVQVTFYMMECVLSFVERYGHVLVSRDKDGTFLGALALVPPYKSSLLFFLHFMRTAVPMGRPVPTQMGEDVAARFDAFGQTLDKHKELMKGTPHWYVQVLGVSEDAQGKGVGRKLMDAAIAMAGETPVRVIYLDCHDGNVPIYKKLGYTLKERFWLTPKGIDDTTPFPFNGMVYGM